MTCQTRSIRQACIFLRHFLMAPLLLFALSACDGEPATSDIGQRFPLASIEAVSPLVSVSAELRDKALLVNFWATWCEPCRREMPELQALAESLDPDHFAVVGVSIDEDANLAREFLLEFGIDFANLHDPGQLLARDRLGIVAYPQTFLVSPDGVIVDRINSALSADHPGIAAWRALQPPGVAATVTGGN